MILFTLLIYLQALNKDQSHLSAKVGTSSNQLQNQLSDVLILRTASRR